MKAQMRLPLLTGMLSGVLILSLLSPALAQTHTEIGQPAPDFTLKDTNGERHTLSDYEGKYVVLEWMDFRCPFTRKHYDTGNMQKLQETYTDKGVVWLSVYSTAPSHRAHVPSKKMAAKNEELGGHQTAMLLDPTGEVGKKYGAKVTPHMYVISPKRELLYRGAIDDQPSHDKSDIDGSTNYVRKTLNAAMSGDEVNPKQVKAYGCPIKYER